MLNTEILSSLRKAHFPLVKVSEIFTLLGIELPEQLYSQVFPKAHELAGSYYLEPTLEQLFEALGPKFFSLFLSLTMTGLIVSIPHQVSYQGTGFSRAVRELKRFRL